ncbi:MAG TPA: winged helix-turn-helix domain-containing protein [Candidatus Saccharimonadales bacterium]|nr:winged helix-turn-helix domain-containing protein [Candidatus Saccharimonadales bacterium]
MLTIAPLPRDDSRLDAVFTALGNAKRRSILETLSYRPATVSQLASEHDISLPAIHRHIRSLEDAELIQRKKIGRTNFVAFNRQAFAAAQAWMMQYRTDWGNDKETLENYAAHFKN